MWSVIDQLEMLVDIIVMRTDLKSTIQKILREETHSNEMESYFTKYLSSIIRPDNFGIDNVRVFKNSSMERILAIQSKFIRSSVEMFGLDKEKIIELVKNYVRDVLGIDFHHHRVWPIPFSNIFPNNDVNNIYN